MFGAQPCPFQVHINKHLRALFPTFSRMSNNKGCIRLTPSMIPKYLNFDDRDSSFFRKWDELPSPKDVQAQAEAQRLVGFNPNPRRDYQSAVPSFVKPQPAVFADMGLLVNWGRTERISEAQTIFALRRVWYDLVPVPELYGWRTDGDLKYIYMEYIRGQTLEQAWDDLEPDDKVSISRELRTIWANLRRLSRTLQIRSWVCFSTLRYVSLDLIHSDREYRTSSIL